jgi:uncharacterized protein YpmB
MKKLNWFVIIVVAITAVIFLSILLATPKDCVTEVKGGTFHLSGHTAFTSVDSVKIYTGSTNQVIHLKRR